MNPIYLPNTKRDVDMQFYEIDNLWIVPKLNATFVILLLHRQISTLRLSTVCKSLFTCSSKTDNHQPITGVVKGVEKTSLIY